MPLTKLVADCSTGETIAVELTAEEVTQRAADGQAAVVEQADVTARETTIRNARPGAALLVKLRDGTALTAAELQVVVRYLALRAIREAQS